MVSLSYSDVFSPTSTRGHYSHLYLLGFSSNLLLTKNSLKGNFLKIDRSFSVLVVRHNSDVPPLT